MIVYLYVSNNTQTDITQNIFKFQKKNDRQILLWDTKKPLSEIEESSIKKGTQRMWII